MAIEQEQVEKEKAVKRAAANVGDTDGGQEQQDQDAERVSVEEMKKQKAAESAGAVPEIEDGESESSAFVDEAARPDGRPLQEQFEEEIEKLKDEFEHVGEILADVRFNEDKAKFFLEALPVIKQVCEVRAGKARFYLHSEPNDECYLMLSPKPSDFDPAWVMIQNPQTGWQAYQEYSEPLLREALIYPKYEDIDWDVDGSGVYTPYGLTDSRLIDTFFQYEMNDPEDPNSASFGADEVEAAETVAKRTTSKPSF